MGALPPHRKGNHPRQADEPGTDDVWPRAKRRHIAGSASDGVRCDLASYACDHGKKRCEPHHWETRH